MRLYNAQRFVNETAVTDNFLKCHQIYQYPPVSTILVSASKEPLGIG